MLLREALKDTLQAVEAIEINGVKNAFSRD